MKISKRALKRWENADKTCQSIRAFIATPAASLSAKEWNRVHKYLLRWMRNAPRKIAYHVPK